MCAGPWPTLCKCYEGSSICEYMMIELDMQQYTELLVYTVVYFYCVFDLKIRFRLLIVL